MLCTRMRLTERRFRINSSISYQNGEGDCESKMIVSSDVRSPFVRPCAIIKMCDTNDTDGKKVGSSSRPSTAMHGKFDTRKKQNEIENTTDAHGSQSSLDRSMDDIGQKRMSSNQSSNRAPLIIVSLYLPSEAKTLAPIDVKRDLRRPPSFCQKFQRNFGNNQCKCKINEKPDLMLRGKEITETSSSLCSLPSNQDNDEILGNDDKSNEECMACSACILEIERTAAPSMAVCVDETALCFSYDDGKYHMDSYGNLNQNLEISCATERDGENDDSPEVSLTLHSRPGSPDASRIIRITLNNKSSNDNSRPTTADERNLLVRDVKSAKL